MKIDLSKILTTLGWSLGLIAVFSTVLSLFGVSLDVVLTIAGSMVGLQLLIAFGIDVLKWAGAVTDGTSGVWSAALNLVGVGGIALVLILKPTFDFPAFDAQLVIIVKFLVLAFGFIVQVTNTKLIHTAVTRGFGVKAFRLSHSSA